MNISNKLKQLEEKIISVKQYEKEQDSFKNSNQQKRNDFKIALNCMLELISGFLAGGAIGYGLDKLFETRFVFFVIFVVIGFIAGLINLSKYLKRL